MEMYAIAVKYENERQFSLGEALRRIRDIPGVQLLDEGASSVARVMLDANSFSLVNNRIGTFCHIETMVPHYPQAALRGW